MITWNADSLQKMEAPKELIMFYNPNVITGAGVQLKNAKNYYIFDNFLFKITLNNKQQPQIQKVYYNLKYLQDHPESLP